MNTLESQWKEYRDACYPAKNCKLDKRQEIETRQAFFAGCLVVLKVATESSANLPEEQAYKNIVSLITPRNLEPALTRQQALTNCRQLYKDGELTRIKRGKQGHHGLPPVYALKK